MYIVYSNVGQENSDKKVDYTKGDHPIWGYKRDAGFRLADQTIEVWHCGSAPTSKG